MLSSASGAPKRIVSLAPDITETLFALNTGHLIVGTAEQSDYPAAAAKILTIGSFVQPHTEQILKLHPDLILCRKEATSSFLLAWLKKIKIPYLVLPGSNEKDIFKTIEILGRRLNRPAIALKLVRSLRRQLRHIRKLGGRTPTLLIQIEENPLMIAGKNTLPHRAIELAGGRNAGSNYSGYPKLQRETLLALNPDIILLPVSPKEKEKKEKWLNSWKRWGSLSAVKKNSLYTIDADLLSRASPRFIEGVKTLSLLLHQHDF